LNTITKAVSHVFKEVFKEILRKNYATKEMSLIENVETMDQLQVIVAEYFLEVLFHGNKKLDFY